ncbi:MAG: TRAM domain-containing protein [Candidatus Thermoplasmatota archaeon]|nr:TRAM domain-containing protein [Candidatus Thermoplasmatota archaeon]MBS3790092.1 TRAM domain-containing protein [Candidatus Thermoplasmatota archaeon]
MSEDVGVSPPVEEGETYEVKIEDIGKEGDGVAKIDDFVIFVPDTDVGDEVEIKITRVLRTLAFGEVTDTDASVDKDIEENEDEEETPEVEEVTVDEIELE